MSVSISALSRMRNSTYQVLVAASYTYGFSDRIRGGAHCQARNFAGLSRALRNPEPQIFRFDVRNSTTATHHIRQPTTWRRKSANQREDTRVALWFRWRR